MARAIVMGDPTYFSVLGGANPHTRNVFGLRKRVDVDLARRQWHALAKALIAHGCEVYVIEPEPRLPGLVYPANAGFLYPLVAGGAHIKKVFYLANLLPSRAPERRVYRPFIRNLGYETREMVTRHEGEADFFPAGRFMIFSYGRIERQRFVPRLGLPPWKRVYGFRSEFGALGELRRISDETPILPVELCLEEHYHGDTVLCSFGPEREFLLAYFDGIAANGRRRLAEEFGTNLIPLSPSDGALYAANSFQVEHNGRLYLFMPEGVSDELLRKVRERSVEPVVVNVSEFLAKGGGSVKCMILDLGPANEQTSTAETQAFRTARSYLTLFGP